MEEPIEPKTLGTDIYEYQLKDNEPIVVPEKESKKRSWIYIGIAVIVIVILAILVI